HADSAGVACNCEWITFFDVEQGLVFYCLLLRPPLRSPLFPYTTLFRSPPRGSSGAGRSRGASRRRYQPGGRSRCGRRRRRRTGRSEEHTSELQSLAYLVCRLLLEKKSNSAVVPRERHLARRCADPCGLV